MEINEIAVSRATLSELDAARALIQRAYRGEEAAASWSHEGELPSGERVSREFLARLIEDADSIFSLAVLDKQIVGTSLVERATRWGCKIGLLSVDPGLQGHGIGDHLLRRAEHDGACSLGARLSFVEVLGHKSALIDYYQRRGYRRTTRSRTYPRPLKLPAELLTYAKRLPRIKSPLLMTKMTGEQD